MLTFGQNEIAEVSGFKTKNDYLQWCKENRFSSHTTVGSKIRSQTLLSVLVKPTSMNLI